MASPPNPRNQRHFQYTSSSSSSAASLKGCFCCLFLLLIFLTLLIVAVALIIALVLKPKKPQLDLDQVAVTYLLLSTTAGPTTQNNTNTTTADAYLSLNITLLFTAENPNKVGIRYGESEFYVMYRGVPVGVAAVPAFEQPAHSTRMVRTGMEVSRFDVMQADAAELVRDTAVNDRVDLKITGDVDARVRVLGFTSPRIELQRREIDRVEERTMASAAEKTAEELRQEIAELNRQQREITERLRDPRGIRRSGASAGVSVQPRQRGLIRPAVEHEDQPSPKRRLSSAVVKLEDGEIKEDAGRSNDTKEHNPSAAAGAASTLDFDKQRPLNPQSNGGFGRDGNPRMRKMDYDVLPTEPVPRVLPKNEDPNLVKRNRRMLGQLLGTLEKFREEDKQLSTTEAYMRRSDSLRRAEEKAREESERLRQQEREQIAEKRRRDLTLRARVAAKAEQKKLELLFILWSEHHKKLNNFLRTKTEPPIYYMTAKPLVEDTATLEQRREQAFLEWKTTRRAELSEHQRQIEENYITNVDKELDRWQNARNARKSNNLNLQETMDKELETHRLEHGPKPRRISGVNDEEEDVEDIVAEDELMDEVIGVPDRVIDGETAKIPESGNGSPDS